ncbi:MAG: protease modulator HflC [Desulfobacterales bacterium]
MTNKTPIILIPVLVILAGIYLSAFTIDETEQAVITRFGKIVRDPITDPGLQFKLPVVDKINRFPKNLQQWDGDPGQIPTLDKTFIWVDAFARWKIVDPVKFVETVGTLFNAKARLDDIIDPSLRNFVTSYRLIEAVRKSDREMDTFEVGISDNISSGEIEEALKPPRITINAGREKIMEGILLQAQPKLDKFGIELADFKIKRINYVEQVQESVYNRMIAERKQIAEMFRSEGRGEARKILGEKERDLKRISSEAYREAQMIKGTADAEATRIYADAFNVDPEFYSFSKTLETYAETLDSQSSLILSTDSEFFQYLKEGTGSSRIRK